MKKKKNTWYRNLKAMILKNERWENSSENTDLKEDMYRKNQLNMML
jgi:hypothetical protein